MHEMAHFVERKSSSHRVSSARLDQTECTLLWRQLPMELSITFKWWWILRLLCAMCWREAPRLASYSPSFDALIRAAKLCIEMIFKASLSTPFCLNGSDGQTLVLVFKPTNNNKIIGERAGRCSCSCRFFVMRCRDTLSPHHYHLFMWNDANAIGADPVQMAAAVDLTHIRQKKAATMNLISFLFWVFDLADDAGQCFRLVSSRRLHSTQFSIIHSSSFSFWPNSNEYYVLINIVCWLLCVCARARAQRIRLQHFHLRFIAPYGAHQHQWALAIEQHSVHRAQNQLDNIFELTINKHFMCKTRTR